MAEQFRTISRFWSGGAVSSSSHTGIKVVLSHRCNPVFFVGAMIFHVVVAGCSPKVGSDLKTVPATGTVMYKGQPVAGAQVGFVNNDKENGKPTTATTDAQGRFQMQTLVGGATQVKGALPGEYKVTVIKMDTSGATMPGFNSGGSISDTAAEDPSKVAGDVKLTLPDKYVDPETSGLTATVKPSGENTFTFELTD